jgi:hypothetical protein
MIEPFLQSIGPSVLRVEPTLSEPRQDHAYGQRHRRRDHRVHDTHSFGPLRGGSFRVSRGYHRPPTRCRDPHLAEHAQDVAADDLLDVLVRVAMGDEHRITFGNSLGFSRPSTYSTSSCSGSSQASRAAASAVCRSDVVAEERVGPEGDVLMPIRFTQYSKWSITDSIEWRGCCASTIVPSAGETSRRPR